MSPATDLEYPNSSIALATAARRCQEGRSEALFPQWAERP